MALANTVLNLPYKATAALTKNRFVKLSGDETVAPNAASTTRTLGVALTDISAAEYALGKATAVAVIGVAWVTAGAAVTQGVRVMSDSAGKAIADAGTATHIPCGVALKAAAADGDLIPVLLTPGLPANP